MKQDCTISQSTTGETTRFHTNGNKRFLKGTHVSEPEGTTGPAIEKYSYSCQTNTTTQPSALTTTLSDHDDEASTPPLRDDAYKPTSWCYIFVHNRKVKLIERQLKKDGVTHFIHKTIKYVPRHKNRGGMREVETPSVSGLIFLQGAPESLHRYLDANISQHHLCKDCSTGKTATIPCGQMEPFMRVAETEPERIRFLLRPFVYYSKNRTLLRIVTGDYAGLEGYVIRIARDRKLVMDVGGMAVAISGIHAERFEEVHKNEADKQERETFYKRNLQERNAFIDRYFHQVRNIQEIEAQVENIDILRLQTLADVRDRKLDLKDAFNTFCFMVEEISYYYSPFIDRFKEDLTPIFEAGKKVMTEIEHAINKFKRGTNKELSQRCETEYEELTTLYGYLFE